MTYPGTGALGQPEDPFSAENTGVQERPSSFTPVGQGIPFGAPAPGFSSAAPPGVARSHGKALIAVIAALAMLLTVGATYAGVKVLSGGGTQPEDVLPENAVAFAKIDLDPAAGQKIAAARLAGKFPKTKGASEGNVKDRVLAAAFDGNEQGLNYNRDVKPWIGNRVALSAVPSPASADGIAPVLAVAFTDETTMTLALTKAKAKTAGSVDSQKFGFAVRDGYVLISDTQADADRVARDTTSLRTNRLATSDADSLDGDQIAVAWADLGAIYALVPKDKRGEVAAQFGTVKPAGRVVVGLHAGSDYLEVKGRSHGLQVMPAQARLGAAPGTGMVARFPADVLGAGSVTGMDGFLTDFWNEYVKHDSFGIREGATTAGLRVPQDFAALFGSETAFAASADQHFGVRVLTADPKRAETVLALTDDLGIPHVTALDAPGGYAASDDPAFAAALSSDGGTLGDSDQFKRAVPDADKASGLIYLNIAKILAATDDSAAQRDWSAVGSLGVALTGGLDQTVTLRLTTR